VEVLDLHLFVYQVFQHLQLINISVLYLLNQSKLTWFNKYNTVLKTLLLL
jgi:hypothetical protein